MIVPQTGSAAGGVRTLLRIEGLCIFTISLIAYAQVGSSWTLMLLLFLLPDISFLGYLAGPASGAFIYNSVHSFIGPLALITVGYLLPMPAAVTIALIWTAHIGFDRALGYGLKYAIGFGHTHLGPIGRGAGDK